MRFLLLILIAACAETDLPLDSSSDGPDETAGLGKEYGYEMGMQGSCYETDSQDVCYRMGMRDYREINATLSRLTGISTQTAEVQKAYRQVAVILPRKNSLDGFLGAVPVGIFRLASAYCNQLVNGEDAEETQNKLFSEPESEIKINFIGRADVVLASEKQSVVANAFIDAFWGENLVLGKDRDAAVAHLTAYIDTSLQKEGYSDTVKGTKKTLLGVCTAMLSSVPVVFY